MRLLIVCWEIIGESEVEHLSQGLTLHLFAFIISLTLKLRPFWGLPFASLPIFIPLCFTTLFHLLLLGLDCEGPLPIFK